MARALISFNNKQLQKDVSRFRKNLFKKQKAFEQIAENTPWDAARYAQLIAKQAAPYQRGYLVKAIKTRSKGKQAQVFVDEKVLFENPTQRGSRFNYALYMHQTNGHMGRNAKIRSGDPRFFTFAREQTKKFIKQDIKFKLKK